MKWFFNIVLFLFFWNLFLVFKNYLPEGLVPFFPLIILIFFAIYLDFKEAIFYSFLGGLFLDFYSSFFGFHLFLFLFLTVLVYFLKTKIVRGEGFLSLIFFLWIGLVVYYFILPILFKVNIGWVFISFYFFKIFLLVLVINTLFAGLIFWPLLKLEEFINNKYKQ